MDEEEEKEEKGEDSCRMDPVKSANVVPHGPEARPRNLLEPLEGLRNVHLN